MHLIIDCYGCSLDLLGDEGYIRRILKNIPRWIDMTPISEPLVLTHLEAPDPDWGVTALIVIAESHISVHTYPQKGVAMVDVFSCKEFNVEKVVDVIHHAFEATSERTMLVHRAVPVFAPGSSQLEPATR